jgi:hypothetical protein
MDRMETTLIAEAKVDPGVLDVYDFEVAARERADFLGVPKSVIRNQDGVDKVRKIRKQALQAEQAKQMQQGMIEQGATAVINKMAA